MARRRRNGKVSHSQTLGPSHMPERESDKIETPASASQYTTALTPQPVHTPVSAGPVELGFELETSQPVDDLAAAAVGSGQFQDAEREDDQGPEQEHERGKRMRGGVIAEAGEKDADEAAQKGAPRKHVPSAVARHRCGFHCRTRPKPPAS